MIRSISWTTLANIVLALAKFSMIWLIAKELSPYSVGVFTLATAVISPIMLFANMKLRTMYVKSINENNIFLFIRTRTTVSIFSFIVITIISVVFFSNIWLIFICIALMRVLDLYADLLYGELQKKDQLKTAAQYLIVKQILLTIVFGLTLFYFSDLLKALAAQLLVQTAITFYEKRRILHNYLEKKTALNIRKLLIISLPIGVTQLIISLNTYIPRYILEGSAGTEILGYFSVISYITVVSNIVIGSITQSYLKPIAKLTAFNKRDELKNLLYKKLYTVSFMLFIVLLAAVYFFSEGLLTVVFDASYAEYKTALIWLSVCVFWNAMNWHIDNVLIVFNYIKSQLVISLICLIISLPLSYYWITTYSINGAAFSMAFNYFLLFVMKQIVLISVLKRGDIDES